MKINIYYGGRGLIDDPALYVMKKMQEVLEELRVTVEKYPIFEHKKSISTLPQTMKEADGVILAVTVEWFGIGGYMQQFLDACWLYGDKEKIASLYMQPVVMANTYGEKEAMLTLMNAWELLGGLPCSGICGYVEDEVAFESDQRYVQIIEKKAENLYRTISQKRVSLPSSNQAVKKSTLRANGIAFTPQETEQLSRYVSDEEYVKKQKQDIQELADLFKNRLEGNMAEGQDEYMEKLEKSFKPSLGFQATYEFVISEKKKPLMVRVKGMKLECAYENEEGADIVAKLNSKVMDDIMAGRCTFQRAFMAGDMSAKGDFKTLRMLDQLFVFS